MNFARYYIEKYYNKYKSCRKPKNNELDESNEVNQVNEVKEVNKVNKVKKTSKNSLNIPLINTSLCESNYLDKYVDELKKNGYTIIPNVYNKADIENYKLLFNKWREDTPNLDYLHNIIESNGIFKYHQVGHQRFAWLARTNLNVLNIFKHLWKTDELVTSFDGCCYYPSDYKGRENYWTHTDQSSQKRGLNCYQSFLSLTNNSQRSFVVYEGTHLLHQEYFKHMKINSPSDWNIIDEDYIKTIENRKKILDVKEGDLVIWDSRTFHQNTCGPPDCNEERLIQYLCYLPKNSENNDAMQNKLRKTFFNTKRTTSHWPYPMNCVPLQPVMYNHYYAKTVEDLVYIDYEKLENIDLDDLMPIIEKLL